MTRNVHTHLADIMKRWNTNLCLSMSLQKLNVYLTFELINLNFGVNCFMLTLIKSLTFK